MTATEPSGPGERHIMFRFPQNGTPLPGSGSRARSRERGYAEAMFAVCALIGELERGPLTATEALDRIGSYAFDAWVLGDRPRVSLVDMYGWVGNWPRDDAR